MNRHFILLLVVMAITMVYALGPRVRSGKKLCVASVSVILTLFTGLRSWWMGDLIKYYTLFRNCIGPDWQEYVFSKPANIGIRLLFHYGNAIGLGYDACLFLIAAFVAITLGILIYRFSPSPYWSYLIYIAMGFYMFTYSGLKQTIAQGFIMLAAMAMFDKKPGKFLLWVFLGGMFHAPAFIFLLAYPFGRKKLDAAYFLIIVGLVLFIFLLRDPLVSMLSELYYDEQDTYTAAKVIGGRFIMMLLILALSLYLRPAHNWDAQYLRVFNLMVLATAFQSLSVYDNNFTRLADYFYQFTILHMAMMLQTGRQIAASLPEHRSRIRYHAKWVYLGLTLVISVFAVWYYRSYLDSSTAILKDYLFFWEIDPYALYGQ